MRQFGLIGKTLTHSLSATYFENKCAQLGLKNYKYNLYPIDSIAEIRTILNENPLIEGLNVTIPYKKDVLPYIDELDSVAKAIGAVNTLKIYRKNNTLRIKGYNTDYLGFLESIKNTNNVKHLNALILGTGGSSKAVAHALNVSGIKFLFVSRDNKDGKTIRYEDLNKDIISKHTLIVNTTPLGMFPHTETCPDIPYAFIGNNHFLFDLVYNPELTLFLEKGLKQNAYICNGLKMLYAQADYAWKIWNDETI